MTARHIPDASALTEWRKSSYSTGAGDDCVEIANGHPALTPVRDSKNPAGPALLFGDTAWAEFLDAVKGGHYN